VDESVCVCVCVSVLEREWYKSKVRLISTDLELISSVKCGTNFDWNSFFLCFILSYFFLFSFFLSFSLKSDQNFPVCWSLRLLLKQFILSWLLNDCHDRKFTIIDWNSKGKFIQRFWWFVLLNKILSRPVNNCTNILQAAFAPIYFGQKITKPICKKRQAVQNTFVQKNCLLTVD